MKYFDKNGHLTIEGLALYVDALKLDKTVQLPETVAQHIEECTSCHGQAVELYANMKSVDTSGLGPHPVLDQPGKKPNAKSGNWLWPLLGVLGIIGLFWFFFPKMNEQQEKSPMEVPEILPDPEIQPPSQHEDSLTVSPGEFADKPNNGSLNQKDQPLPKPPNDVIQQPDLIASRMEPFDELENLVGEVFRSEEIEISKPLNNTRFVAGQSIQFQWTGASGQSFEIKILDNKGKVIVEKKNVQNPLQVSVLQPGLYYWKLETAEDLFHVGKFFVIGIE